MVVILYAHFNKYVSNSQANKQRSLTISTLFPESYLQRFLVFDSQRLLLENVNAANWLDVLFYSSG